MAKRVEDHAKWITKVLHTRHFDEKVTIGDGVLLLEVRTSRRAVDIYSKQTNYHQKFWGEIIFFLALAKPFLYTRRGNDFDQTEMEQVRTTASMCIPYIATMRPDDMNRCICALRRRPSCTAAEAMSMSGGDCERVRSSGTHPRATGNS
ncbi:hypothetical protein F2Q69_00009895 [Brassica cretica]|uniref:Uncharacterized protein n=1 Tax=Brassica cretica TaxID=69181 RepID=A0A8S9PEL1_BRACR|nr:hypothetical protein F2Q69_00009895 [Brassica cretica]